MNMDQERLETLILKFYNKELSEDEKVEFENLLQTDEEVLKLFSEWSFVDQSVNTLKIHHEKLEEDSYPVQDAYKIRPRRNILRSIVNVAAIISIPLLLGAAYLFLKVNTPEPITFSEVTCDNGKVISVRLADSSLVHLYTGSTLRYPNRFDQNGREVELSGQATFEVKSNPKNPFTVISNGGYKVKAYGTKFNVQNYSQSENIVVYLDHGAVSFEAPQLRSSVKMKPKTELAYQKHNNRYTLREVNSKEYDSYTKGILVFSNRKLEDIVQKLELTYKIKIEIQNEELKSYRYTATFNNESIYHILNMLKMSTPNLTWKEEKDKIVLTKS